MLEWSCGFACFGLAWLCWHLARLPPPSPPRRLVLTPFLPQVSPDTYIAAEISVHEQITVGLTLQAAHRLGCPAEARQLLTYRNGHGELLYLVMLGVN